MSELDNMLKSLTKQFGQGSAFRMDTLPATGVSGWTSTGCPKINALIGRDGIPDGRVTSIIGPPSASKTTFVTHIMSQMQRRGGNVFYWNTECSYDPERAVRIGLDLNKVAVSQPGTCEEAFEMLGHICQNVTGNVPTLVAWDTFSATPTLEEVYGTGEEGKKREKKDEMIDEVSLGGKGLGAHARIVSQQMRKLQGRMESKNVTLVVVLQSKEKIDLTWGSGVTYLAEKPWYFYSNVQFECKRVGYVKSGEVTTGIRVSVSCRKNKVGPPFKVATVDCLFSTGYDISGMDLEQATKNGIISVLGGGWFTYAAPTGVVKFTREPQANSQLCWKELLEKYPQINDALRGVTENASVITEEE